MIPKVDEIDWDVKLASALFNVGEDQIDELALQLINEVQNDASIDGVVFDINKQVYKHIAARNWTIHTVFAADGYVGIAEGKDYRVAQWEEASEFKNEMGDGELFVSFDCTNPIGYIHDQLEKLLARHIDSSFVVALCADVIRRLYPQLEFSRTTPKVNPMLFKQMGLEGIEEFQTEVVSKVLHIFGMAHFNRHIKRDRKYSADITSCLLTITELPKVVTDRDLLALVASYENQDRLSTEEVRMVEAYLLNHRH